MQTIGGREPLHGDLGRFYDAIENPRKTRGELPILRDAELRAYIADVRERTLEVLDEVDDRRRRRGPAAARRLRLRDAARPRAQHNETMLQLLQMVDGYEPVRADFGPRRSRPPRGRDVAVEAGEYEIGAPRPRLRLRQRAPAATRSRSPPSRSTEPRSPTPPTPRFIEETGAEPPLYWERDGEGAGSARRWAAATDRPRPARHPRLLGARPTPSPAGPASGCRASTSGRRPAPPGRGRPRLGVDLLGLPRLPRLRGLPLPRSTPRSSSATSYKVLRGGSWATHPRVVRPSFRNWDLPQRRQIFSGLRCARDA